MLRGLHYAFAMSLQHLTQTNVEPLLKTYTIFARRSATREAAYRWLQLLPASGFGPEIGQLTGTEVLKGWTAAPFGVPLSCKTLGTFYWVGDWLTFRLVRSLRAWLSLCHPANPRSVP